MTRKSMLLYDGSAFICNCWISYVAHWMKAYAVLFLKMDYGPFAWAWRKEEGAVEPISPWWTARSRFTCPDKKNLNVKINTITKKKGVDPHRPCYFATNTIHRPYYLPKHWNTKSKAAVWRDGVTEKNKTRFTDLLGFNIGFQILSYWTRLILLGMWFIHDFNSRANENIINLIDGEDNL